MEVNTMGSKKLSDEQELTLVQEYIQGVPVKDLMIKYNFATKKSITDKVKKYYGDNYKDLIEEARKNRKSYSYSFDGVINEFNAYFLGLLLTDGYITTRGYDVGLDLVDEDCIAFLAKGIGTTYKAYEPTKMPKDYKRKTRYRLILSDKKLVEDLSKYNIIQNKSLILEGPSLSVEEERFIPYIIRGIIDGDGSVAPTSYGAAQFQICSASEKFIDWLIYILTNKMYMMDINKTFYNNGYNGLWRLSSANQENILKLISLSYNKPFGMERKYNELRKTFRDYNGSKLFL